MPDRTFGNRPDDNDAEWITRRDALVAELQATPNASRALRRFTRALAAIEDPSRLQSAFTWLERQNRSTRN